MSVECGFELGGAVTAKTVRGARRNGNDGIYPWRVGAARLVTRTKNRYRRTASAILQVAPAAETVFVCLVSRVPVLGLVFLGFTPIFWGSPALLGSLGVVLAENRLSVLLSLLRPP